MKYRLVSAFAWQDQWFTKANESEIASLPAEVIEQYLKAGAIEVVAGSKPAKAPRRYVLASTEETPAAKTATE